MVERDRRGRKDSGRGGVIHQPEPRRLEHPRAHVGGQLVFGPTHSRKLEAHLEPRLGCHQWACRFSRQRRKKFVATPDSNRYVCTNTRTLFRRQCPVRFDLKKSLLVNEGFN